MGKLTDRVAIVTGASRGIGRAIALRLADEGAHLALVYRSQQEQAEAVASEISERGRQVVTIQADVTDENQVRRLVMMTAHQFGHIDILVPNAGVVADQLVATMTLAQWELVIQTNLRGPFLCIREVLPHMMARKSGSIVNISSVAVDHASRGHVNYVSAKGGINALTRSLAVELAPKKIRVNAVSPGVILTDMSQRVRNLAQEQILQKIPLQRFGNPEDVANAVCFLASDEASYITGHILSVTGGLDL